MLGALEWLSTQFERNPGPALFLALCLIVAWPFAMLVPVTSYVKSLSPEPMRWGKVRPQRRRLDLRAGGRQEWQQSGGSPVRPARSPHLTRAVNPPTPHASVDERRACLHGNHAQPLALGLGDGTPLTRDRLKVTPAARSGLQSPLHLLGKVLVSGHIQAVCRRDWLSVAHSSVGSQTPSPPVCRRLHVLSGVAPRNCQTRQANPQLRKFTPPHVSETFSQPCARLYSDAAKQDAAITLTSLQQNHLPYQLLYLVASRNPFQR